MFPWSSVFSAEPLLPGQRSPEELVQNTLMLELSALLKYTERQRLERASELRRRASCVDYSWLVNRRRSSFELPPREVLELQDLCSKIRPSMCGPVILRVRRLVTEFEPELSEVSRIFRSVLCECLDDEDASLRTRTGRWSLRRSKSMSLIGHRPRVQALPPWCREMKGVGGRGLHVDERNLRVQWEEEGAMRTQRRVMSMPEISSVEEKADYTDSTPF
ncbi:protein RD3 [Denticeps clupeoides]|uniref:Protein RD3-like n=1 Tax=Denticeps clupeoides TaxID=299321 RepID=A0AAY4EMT4_9TELE|nr:protein RD3-like [Denticeps clupeoides]XP_028840475.1 protein RD3-like [Denticeps clupeoides]